jgi:hypothetical protein
MRRLLRRRLLLVASGGALLMLGWAGAFAVLDSSWGDTRQADEAAWLNARIASWVDTTPVRSTRILDGRTVMVEVVDTSLRMLAHPRFPQERFSTLWKSEALVVEKDLPGGRVIRLSRPLEMVRATPGLPWSLALLALALGSLAPLTLLWMQVRGERRRIDLLAGTARAAEAGRRLPEENLEIRWGLEEEVRLAHELGAEVRRLRILLHSEERRLQRLLDATREWLHDEEVLG